MRLTRTPVLEHPGGTRTGWHAVEPFDDLVASWAVTAPSAEVEVQCSVDGAETAWFVLGRRTPDGWSSVAGQEDEVARVDVDVLRLAAPAEAFRLRVRGAEPREVERLAAVTTLRPFPSAAPVHVPPGAWELSAEPLSQQAFVGVDVDLDGGGASWCCPTSLAMVLRRHGHAVTVPAVARAVYDPVYGGCGNWSVNAAVAASFGLDAVVTRLRGLDEAYALVGAGLPVIVSVVVEPGALPGFPLEHGTAGHLVVLAGWDAQGDPVVLDPAAATTATVRRVYPAGPFGRAWVTGTGGLAILVRPPDAVLPPGTGRW